MLDASIKQQAYAAMDDATSFRFAVVRDGAQPPVADGEDAVQLLAADSVAAIRQPVKLLRHMARTFFGEKFTGVSKPPDTDGGAALFIVAELAELDTSFIEGLSEEGDTRPTPPAGERPPIAVPEAGAEVPLGQKETLKLSDQETLQLATDDDWE